MATRKMKRYDEGGMAPEMGGPRAPDQEAPIGPSGEDPRGPLAAKLAGLMGGNKMMTVRPPQDQDGPANLAAMMGRTPTPQAQDFPPERIIGDPGPTQEDVAPKRNRPMPMPIRGEQMGSTDDYQVPSYGRPRSPMGSMPTPQAQDTGPTLGSASGREPMDGPTPNPMVGALKNILANNMGRRGRNPGRARAMGANMGGFSAGGSVSKASSRADGIAQRGKTRGKMR
jgi:hypothetical protein